MLNRRFQRKLKKTVIKTADEVILRKYEYTTIKLRIMGDILDKTNKTREITDKNRHEYKRINIRVKFQKIQKLQEAKHITGMNIEIKNLRNEQKRRTI